MKWPKSHDKRPEKIKCKNQKLKAKYDNALRNSKILRYEWFTLTKINLKKTPKLIISDSSPN